MIKFCQKCSKEDKIYETELYKLAWVYNHGLR